MNIRGGYGLILLAALSLSRSALSEDSARFAGHGFAGHGSQRGSVHTGPSQPYLGIDFRDVGDDQVAQLKLRDTKGAEIIRVDHDAPAGKMGLREHDVVLQMNGVTIDGEEQLRRMLKDCPPGRTVVMTIARDGQTIVTSAPMADRAELERQAWEQHLNAAGPQAPSFVAPDGDVPALTPAPATAPTFTSHYSKSFLGSLLTSPTYTGLMLEAVGPQLGSYFGVNGGGLLIRSVADNSPAAMAGLKAGDVVVKANASPVGSLSHWTKTIREAKGKPVSVVIVRDRQEKLLILTPDVKHKSALEMPFEEHEPVRLACLLRL
jgi:serine protease Do